MVGVMWGLHGVWHWLMLVLVRERASRSGNIMMIDHGDALSVFSKIKLGEGRPAMRSLGWAHGVDAESDDPR